MSFLTILASVAGGLGLICLAAGQLDDMMGDGSSAPALTALGALLLGAGALLYLFFGLPASLAQDAVSLFLPRA